MDKAHEFLTIRRVSNGYIVGPAPRGDRPFADESHVFTTPEALGDWIKGWARGHEGEAVAPKVGEWVYYALRPEEMRPCDKPGDGVNAEVVGVEAVVPAGPGKASLYLSLRYRGPGANQVVRHRVTHSTSEPGCRFRMVKA